MNARTDQHRPSAINPAEYRFVAFECMKIEGFADCAMILENRRIIAAHMERTGGTYSRHQHGGNCHICGAWCIYTVLFYHAPSNSYIRTGTDCAEKLDRAVDASAFRASIRDARENQAGKAKARAILADAGLDAAWAIYTGEYTGHQQEAIVCDIVGRLVRFGSVSEKQLALIGRLCEHIANRPAIEAARKAEADAAAPAPVTSDRIKICGTVLSTKLVESQFGETRKCLIRTEAGWKAWGTCPAGVEKGNKIEFCARVEVSKDDPKFAYYSRATKVVVLEAQAAQVIAA